jgi:hypothetical protein
MTLSEPEVECIEDTDENKIWYLNDQLHRTDGPAVEDRHGDKYWYQNNQQHRTDGPAVEHADGSKGWYLNDQRHRTDGPAIEYSNGNKYWYIKGQNITNEIEYWMKENDIPEDHNKWTDNQKMLFKLTWC